MLLSVWAALNLAYSWGRHWLCAVQLRAGYTLQPMKDAMQIGAKALAAELPPDRSTGLRRGLGGRRSHAGFLGFMHQD